MIRSVAVIGLGAIGGSLVQALQRNNIRVTGYDSNEATVRSATCDAHSFTDGVDIDADVVVIATPPRAVATVLRQIASRIPRGCIVTDVASTKRDVLQAARDAGLAHSFVGSHPLAGTHASGWDAARANMFEGATVFVCPADSDKAVPSVSQLWSTVGAKVRLISAEEHDRRIAWLSHLPQMLSTALALTLKDAGVKRADLGTGGRDMTRLAGSDPEMWLDIVATNADMLEEPMSKLIDALVELRTAIGARAELGLNSKFSAAREWSA